MTAHLFTLLCWLLVWTYWLVSALGAKKTVRLQQGLVLRICTRAAVFISYTLAFFPLHAGWLTLNVLPATLLFQCLGMGCCAVGLAFAVWARYHLGRNWSGAVTLKQDHELIQSGPYAVVRHPIYAGFLLAMLGTALVLGELRGLLAFLAMAASFTKKMIDEERAMGGQFPDGYPLYRARVRRLIPFVF